MFNNMSFNLENLNMSCSPMYNSQNSGQVLGYMCNSNKIVEGFQNARPISGVVTDPKTTPILCNIWNGAFNNQPCSILYNVSLDWGPLTMVGVLNSKSWDQIYLFQNGNTVIIYDTYSWSSFYYTGTVPQIGSNLNLSKVGEIKLHGIGNSLTLVSSTMRFLVAPMVIGTLGMKFKNPPYYQGYLSGKNINDGNPLAILNILKNSQRINLLGYLSLEIKNGTINNNKINSVANSKNMNYTYVAYDGINTILYDVNSDITYSYKGNLIQSNNFNFTKPDGIYGQMNSNTFDLLGPYLTNLGKNYCTYSDFSATQFGVPSVGDRNDCYIDSNANIFPCTARPISVPVTFSKSQVPDFAFSLCQDGNKVRFVMKNISYSYIGTIKIGDVIDMTDPKITTDSNLTYFDNSQRMNLTTPPSTLYLRGGDLSSVLPVTGYGVNGNDKYYFVQDGSNIKFVKLIFVIGTIPNPNFLKNTTPSMIASYNTVKSGGKLSPRNGQSLSQYLRANPENIQGPTNVVASLTSYVLPGTLGSAIYFIDPKIKQFGTTVSKPDMSQIYSNTYTLITSLSPSPSPSFTPSFTPTMTPSFSQSTQASSGINLLNSVQSETNNLLNTLKNSFGV